MAHFWGRAPLGKSGVHLIIWCSSLLGSLWRSFCQPCHDQGHAAMLTGLRHVEETMVPVTGCGVGGSLSSCRLMPPSRVGEWSGVTAPALAPLRFQGICMLSYIGWLILALRSIWGFSIEISSSPIWKSWVKAKCQGKCACSTRENHLSGCGVGFNHDAGASVSCSDRVNSHSREESEIILVTHCQTVSETVGSDCICVQRYLYMRPLQWWLRTRGFSPRVNQLRMIKVMQRCIHALDMWRKPWFMSQGPVLGAPCCCIR